VLGFGFIWGQWRIQERLHSVYNSRSVHWFVFVLLRLCSAHPCLVIGLLPPSSYVCCFRLEINTLKTNTTWATAAASDPAPAASSGGFKVQQQLWASRAAGEYKPTGENCGSNEGAGEKSPWWRNLSTSCKFQWFVIQVFLIMLLCQLISQEIFWVAYVFKTLLSPL